ncbi:hypothetical protein Leryth_005184 [Lithospermum erythrorhizon]|nr:hypothetical protein Leryth_005184 [Lithospermum erythrorhizon]
MALFFNTPLHFHSSTSSSSSKLFSNNKPQLRIPLASNSSNDVSNNEETKEPKIKKRHSEQSSWEAKDEQGNDYLYVLGKESANMNIAVGARAACHLVKNYLADVLNTKVPLILGIWGGKGQGKTFQTELIFRAMGVEPIIMSAGELESERAGEPGKLIRDRYRTASLVVQNQGKMSCLMINDIDAGLGRFDTGGVESLTKNLIGRKRMEKLPVFTPPTQTLEALLESGHSLLNEQKLVMTNKLSKEYLKNMDD